MSMKRMSSVFRRSASNGSTRGTGIPNNASSTQSNDDALKTLKEFQEKVKRGLPFDWNTTTLSAVLDLIRHKESIDDRRLVLEHALTFVARLEDGPLSSALRDRIIQLLYNDLSHPPATSISNKFAWRTADGSYNNIDLPDLGKAGMPYARSVQQSHPLPRNQLPDAGLVFDTLLRREKFVKHPGGLSSLMFSFAALVIHSVFRTSHRDVNINETSSYVDLAPLYGNNQDDQNRLRVRDGRGLLYPDAFAEDRLLLLPPAVCVLLVLFNRNHNYIASKLLEINERGTYRDPSALSLDEPASKAQLLAQEEDIFQTARLINCGWFGSVVFSDYFSCILGLVRDGNSWSLNPFDEIRKDDHSLFERGKGNVCSVEFNCLYRWHATTSVEDEAWTSMVFNDIFEGKPVEEVTSDDFKKAAFKLQQQHRDARQWPIGSLKREASGNFKDEDLANVLHNATEHPAATFGARGTPSVMRLNEIMGIEQNRRWGVCSLNDFRKYLGLKTYSTFLEWNSNPEIAEAAEMLYGNIDNLELYVGLQAEETKPLVEGAGLCPGYTISRAILSDAIALTRGDRFFTHDFTPFNLTAWGFQDCQRDPNAFGFGSTLGRLFLRTLPDNFTENSVYTFFPLMTPDSMKTHLTKLNQLDMYDLSRPKSRSNVIVVDGYSQALAILKDSKGFSKPYAAKAARVVKGKGFYPAEGPQERQSVASALSGSPDIVENIGVYFYTTAKKLIDRSSYTLVGSNRRGVDVVRSVLRVLPIMWVANNLAGVQLKSEGNPSGLFTAEELFDILGEIYSFIFLEVEPSKAMVLQKRVKSHVLKLLGIIKVHLDVSPAGSRLSVAGVINSVTSLFSRPNKTEHHDIVKRLAEISDSTDRLANTILAVMVGATVELSLATTNMVHLYVGSDKAAEISKLCSGSTELSKIKGYVYEALRIEPPFEGVYRISTKEQSISGLSLKDNDRVFLHIASANLSEKIFPDARHVDTTRVGTDFLRAEGVFEYLGEALTIEIMSQVLRAVFELDDVERAPGTSGSLKRFKDSSRPECRYAYLNHGQVICEWPMSMSILYNLRK